MIAFNKGGQLFPTLYEITVSSLALLVIHTMLSLSSKCESLSEYQIALLHHWPGEDIRIDWWNPVFAMANDRPVSGWTWSSDSLMMILCLCAYRSGCNFIHLLIRNLLFQTCHRIWTDSKGHLIIVVFLTYLYVHVCQVDWLFFLFFMLTDLTSGHFNHLLIVNCLTLLIQCLLFTVLLLLFPERGPLTGWSSCTRMLFTKLGLVSLTYKKSSFSNLFIILEPRL